MTHHAWFRGLALAAFAATGCHDDQHAWHAQLAAPAVHQLAGSWRIELRRSEVSENPSPVTVVGDIAFTLNELGLPVSGFDVRPMLFGTYDIDFSPFGFEAGLSAGVPSVAGVRRGDSMIVELGPASSLPVEMRGVVAGDSVTGRWMAVRRAGIGTGGDFVLRRR